MLEDARAASEEAECDKEKVGDDNLSIMLSTLPLCMQMSRYLECRISIVKGNIFSSTTVRAHRRQGALKGFLLRSVLLEPFQIDKQFSFVQGSVRDYHQSAQVA